MDRSRIPPVLGAFSDYIKTVVPYLKATNPTANIPSWKRLCLSQAEMNKTESFLKKWVTNNSAAPGVYEQHINPNTRNKRTRMAVVRLMKDFRKFFIPLLDRMSGSADLTEGDKLVLRIKLHPKTHKKNTKKIDKNVGIIAIPQGTGKLLFKFYTTVDDIFVGIPPDADMVNTAIAVVVPEYNGDDNSGKIKATPPLHPLDGTYLEYHTKAKVRMTFSSVYAGMDLYIFARFCNGRHPELVGAWSQPLIVKIPF